MSSKEMLDNSNRKETLDSSKVRKWKVTRLSFWNSHKQQNFDKFIVSDEGGKQVCSHENIRQAVVEALRIAASQKVSVEIVG